MDQKLFELAIKQRIQNSATYAQIKIARFYKRKLNRERCQFFRHNGMFEATIYFEHTSLDDSNDGKIKPSSNVQVYGEFTPEQPWQVLIPCTYDNKSRCFKAILVIRTGQQFKFVIDDGKHFMVSKRYPCQRDKNGNKNNVFDTRQSTLHQEYVFDRRIISLIQSSFSVSMMSLNTQIRSMQNVFRTTLIKESMKKVQSPVKHQESLTNIYNQVIHEVLQQWTPHQTFYQSILKPAENLPCFDQNDGLFYGQRLPIRTVKQLIEIYLKDTSFIEQDLEERDRVHNTSELLIHQKYLQQMQMLHEFEQIDKLNETQNGIETKRSESQQSDQKRTVVVDDFSSEMRNRVDLSGNLSGEFVNSLLGKSVLSKSGANTPKKSVHGPSNKRDQKFLAGTLHNRLSNITEKERNISQMEASFIKEPSKIPSGLKQALFRNEPSKIPTGLTQALSQIDTTLNDMKELQRKSDGMNQSGVQRKSDGMNQSNGMNQSDGMNQSGVINPNNRRKYNIHRGRSRRGRSREQAQNAEHD